MRRRLFDSIVPADALRGIGHVAWRKVDGMSELAIRVTGGLCVPTSMIGWHEAHGWKFWPSLKDLLPVFTTPRGGILYSMPPQHGATRRCSPEHPCASPSMLHVQLWGECFVEETHARR